MKKQLLSFNLLIVSIFFSCNLIKIETPDAVSTAYPKFIKESQMKVEFNSNNICYKLYNDTIYAVKGAELKSCLINQRSAMVYLWSPFCKSESCLSIGAVQDYCNENNYELFVLLETYDAEIIDVQKSPTRPYYSINHFYHESNAMDKHIKSFFKELTGEKKRDGRYFVFENGNYSSSIEVDKLLEN